MRTTTTPPGAHDATSPAGQPLLAASSLYRFYRVGEDETLALKGVSLHLDAGEMVAVAGPSGSGKSTLLALLAGLDEPDGGTVTVAGQRLSHRSEVDRSRLRARHLGLLFQSANLLEHLSVAQNIALAQSLVSRRERSDRAAMLDDVGLGHRSGSYPSQLSGGEAARAGLAVALANDPAVLLADEPTGEVDAETEAGLIELLRRRADSGHAVLLVTHSDAVARAADRVVAMFDGQEQP